jgi:hypothetical protein
MSRQSRATQGLRGSDVLERRAAFRRKQLAFPSILAAEQQAEQQKKTEAFRKKEFKQKERHADRAMAFKKREAEKGLGLSMAKFGGTLASSNLFGSFGKGDLTAGFRPGGPGDAPPSAANTGAFSNLSLAGGVKGGISGGLLGYGLGKVAGKGERWFGLGGTLLGAGYGSGLFDNAIAGATEFFSGLGKAA